MKRNRNGFESLTSGSLHFSKNQYILLTGSKTKSILIESVWFLISGNESPSIALFYCCCNSITHFLWTRTWKAVSKIVHRKWNRGKPTEWQRVLVENGIMCHRIIALNWAYCTELRIVHSWVHWVSLNSVFPNPQNCSVWNFIHCKHRNKRKKIAIFIFRSELKKWLFLKNANIYNAA